jgi:hypothetical protein
MWKYSRNLRGVLAGPPGTVPPIIVATRAGETADGPDCLGT